MVERILRFDLDEDANGNEAIPKDWEFLFITEDEADAFKAGVEFVNDSSLDIEKLGPDSFVEKDHICYEWAIRLHENGK